MHSDTAAPRNGNAFIYLPKLLQNINRSTIDNSKTLKLPKCPSAVEEINKSWCISTMEYHTAKKSLNDCYMQQHKKFHRHNVEKRDKNKNKIQTQKVLTT